MPWPISNHESPDVDLTIPEVTAPHYLYALLKTDGQAFRENNYAVARHHLEDAIERFTNRSTGGQRPSASISEQRLRTWKSAFEEMGLLTVDADGSVRATRFGNAVIAGLKKVENSLSSSNARIASLGAQVANRVLLAKPDNNGRPAAGVPERADLRPLRAIWRAFRRCGDRLHWQDINRVLGHIHSENEVDEAIDRITTFRQTYPDAYPSDAESLNALGPTTLSDDPRHITPWINRAGLGGMLIPSDADQNEFRHLSEDAIEVIDGLLLADSPEPPESAFTDRGAYIAYLMEPVVAAEQPALTPSDVTLIEQVQEASSVFGRRQIIALSGIPGTGKSRLARLAADAITGGDPYRVLDIQFHETTSYEDFIEGFVPKPDGQGFTLRSKSFLTINERALRSPETPHVLIIEEFTRANVHAVIGELMTFIEHRKRPFTLSISQKETAVAENLIIIATMNPRDRSALTLDDAIRRRLHQLEIPSSPQALADMLAGKLDQPLLDQLSAWFTRFITILPFGHGVFAEASSRASLQSIWRGTVSGFLRDSLGQVMEEFAEAHSSFPFGEEAASEAAPPQS